MIQPTGPFNLVSSHTVAMTENTVEPIQSLFNSVGSQAGNDMGVQPEAQFDFGGPGGM